MIEVLFVGGPLDGDYLECEEEAPAVIELPERMVREILAGAEQVPWPPVWLYLHVYRRTVDGGALAYIGLLPRRPDFFAVTGLTPHG